nr:hypothetical protein [Tanacetum cinerariifolium]
RIIFEKINKMDFIDARGRDFYSEEIENFLNDDSIPIGVENSEFNMEEDIIFLERLLNNGSESIKRVKDDSSVSTTISNPLFDNDEINSDELKLHVESNSVESTSNHDTVKFYNLDEFSGPLIPIHNAEEERIRREHENDSHKEEINIIFKTNDVLPLGVENNDDSDGEVDAIDDLRVDNSISNSEHEFSKSEDSDFDNPSVPLPPLEPLDEEFDFKIDFGDEISVVRNTIIEFECCWVIIYINPLNLSTVRFGVDAAMKLKEKL